MNPHRKPHLLPGPRLLYLVPDRRVERLAYVPSGRTLHIVDIENLMGGPDEGSEALRAASVEYAGLAPIGPADHVIVACHPHLVLHAAQAWPHAQVLSATGPDGADHALLRQVDDDRWVAQRYDRVVVGSGDAIFTDAVTRLQEWGIAVGVAARESALSYQLGRTADFVRYLSEGIATQECA